MVLPIFVWYDSLQQIQRIINIVILSAFVVVNLGVFILLKSNVDCWGIITMILHLVVCFVRLLTPDFKDQFLADEGMIYYELSFFAQTLIWVSVYNFTFELSLVATNLIKKDSEKLRSWIKYSRICMIILMGTMSLMALISNMKSVEASDQETLNFFVN